MPVHDLLALEPGSNEQLGKLRLGYTETRGGIGLRRSIGRLYERDDAEAVLVHSGSEEAIFTFMNAVLQPGDHVVVQFPAYQSHYSIPQSLGASVTRWHSDLEADGSPDVGELERLISPATRAIVLTTPNNPTGYSFDRRQIEAVVGIARRHELWLFGDEVYRGLEREAEQIPAVYDIYERGVSLGGLSKAYGLAGLRIGWLATRDRGLYEMMTAFKDYLTICVSAPSELLAELALNHGDELIERVRRIVEPNLDYLDDFFSRRTELFAWKRPPAGTTGFPRYLGGSSEEFCSQAAEQAGVLLLPSTVFDAGDAHVRFGYGRLNLPKALGALDAWIDQRQPS